jgi:hypothetical protein
MTEDDFYSGNGNPGNGKINDFTDSNYGGNSEYGNYGNDGDNEVESTPLIPKVIALIKKFLPLIFIVIIALLLLNTFILSKTKVTTSITDSFGKSLTNANISITRESVFPWENVSTKIKAGDEIELYFGEYKIQVTLIGYKTINETFLVSPTNNEIIYPLAKDISAQINIFPEMTETKRIYPNEKIDLQLLVTNNGKRTISGEDITATTNNLQVEFNPPSSKTINGLLVNTTNNPISVTISPKLTKPITKDTNASVIFNLGGIAETKKIINFTIMPSIATSEIIMLLPSKDFNMLNKQNDSTMRGSIKWTPPQGKTYSNETTDFLLEIQMNSEYISKTNWFSFENNSLSKIISMKPNETKTIDINVNPPNDANENDKALGVLRVSSVALDSNKEISINFTIKTALKSNLVLTRTTNIPIVWRTDINDFNEISYTTAAEFGIKNTGNLPISNISAKINYPQVIGGTTTTPENPVTLCTSFVEISDLNFEDAGTLRITGIIAPQATIPIPLHISPQNISTSNKQNGIIDCVLELSYTDPKNNEPTITKLPFKIELKNKPTTA